MLGTNGSSADSRVHMRTKRLERSATAPQPEFAESAQPGQRLAIPQPVRRDLARDDVVEVAHGETFDVDVAPPGVLEALDAVRGEDQVEVEGAVLELDEV